MRIRIITALLLCFAAAPALAESAGPELVDGAPDRYVVVAGDTLWGIAGKFLKEPWRWSELWKANRGDIKTPNRIYPGQVIILDRNGADPAFKLGRMLGQGNSRLEPQVYEDRSAEPIPSIPPRAIRPFLSEPRIVEAADLERAPRIVATQEGRVLLGVGNLAYAIGIEDKSLVWQAYRPAKPLTDPETGAVLGFEAFYLGTLQVSRHAAQGEATTLEVVTSKREMGVGDRLVPATRPDVITYAPHPPANPVEGRIASIYEGVNEAGPQGIVTINRGKLQGIEMGHVLAIYRRGKGISLDKDLDKDKVLRLPDERVGLLFIFSVYDRISYGLVMSARMPVGVNDIVRQP